MREFLLSFTVTLSVISFAFSQDLSFADNSSALKFYGDVMINALEDDNRIMAGEQFAQIFDNEIKAEGSFDNSLEDLKFISVQYPEDRSFRFISWQLKESDSKFSYKTYLQTSDSKIQQFTNDGYVSVDDTDKTYSKNWPAQLVYKILDAGSSENKSYVVFGMKQVDQFNKIKVADVLTVKDGLASFGEPLFVKNADSERPRKSNRIVLTYGADANASLNYNPALAMIVHDNVIPQAGMMPGQGVSNYPDGSYQAYELKEGQWKHIDKLYNTTMSEAPRPNPVKKKEGGIFGKKSTAKKKRN